MQRKAKMALAVGAVLVAGAAGLLALNAAEARGGDAERGHGWRGHMGWHGGGFGRLMERFDTDGDDRLTQEELDQARRDLLARFDADKDGSLSLQEFEPLWLEVMRRQMVRSFQHLDVDGNALVTSEEFLEPYSRIVKRLDRNDDGVLDDQDRRWRRHWQRGPGPERGPGTPPAQTPNQG